MLYAPATEMKKYPAVLGKKKVNIKEQLKNIQCVFFKQQQKKSAISISLAYNHVMSGAC